MEQPELVERVARAICEAGTEEPGLCFRDDDPHEAKCVQSCVGCRNVARAAIAALTATADDALRDDAEWLRQLALAMREVDQFHGHADHLERIASRLAIPSEPTEEMIEAGREAVRLNYSCDKPDDFYTAIYKAMIERISNGVSE